MKTRVRLLILVFLLAGLIASCMNRELDEDTPTSPPAPTDVWSSLLQVTPDSGGWHVCKI